MGGGALILIDTHALIWLDQNDPALGRHSRELADEALNDGTLAVSAMSFWEIAMLVVKGRITKDIDLKRWRLDLIDRKSVV
jgi:PIN domain nuclease of toxin-antitoxin system